MFDAERRPAGGLVAMTLPVARELARSGIPGHDYRPGIFETSMRLGLSPELQESLGRTVPSPAPLCRPAEFAGLVRHLVINAYLNGE